MSEVLWSHQDDERDLVRLESWCEDLGGRYRYSLVAEASRSGDAVMVGLDADALTRLYNAAGFELARRNGPSEPAPAPDAAPAPAPTNAELAERVSHLHEWAPGADRRMDRMDSYTHATHGLAKAAHTRLNAEQEIRQQREQDVDRRLAEAGEQMRQMREQIVRIEESMRRSVREIGSSLLAMAPKQAEPERCTTQFDAGQCAGVRGHRGDCSPDADMILSESEQREHWCGGSNDHAPHVHSVDREELMCLGSQGGLYGRGYVGQGHAKLDAALTRQAEPEQAEPEPAARCQCGHHFREHEGRTNACTATWTIPPSVCSCSRFRLER